MRTEKTMNRRAAFTLVLPALLLGMLVGCAPVQPMPASITLADGGRKQQLKPGDAAYAAIAVMAALTLDGALLYGVLLFLGALAVRSWVVVKREELD